MAIYINSSKHLENPIRISQKNNVWATENNIQFIKLVRDETDASLRDSKNFVDAFMNHLNEITPKMTKMRNEIINSLNDLDPNELVTLTNALKEIGRAHV